MFGFKSFIPVVSVFFFVSSFTANVFAAHSNFKFDMTNQTSHTICLKNSGHYQAHYPPKQICVPVGNHAELIYQMYMEAKKEWTMDDGLDFDVYKDSTNSESNKVGRFTLSVTEVDNDPFLPSISYPTESKIDDNRTDFTLNNNTTIYMINPVNFAGGDFRSTGKIIFKETK